MAAGQDDVELALRNGLAGRATTANDSAGLGEPSATAAVGKCKIVLHVTGTNQEWEQRRSTLQSVSQSVRSRISRVASITERLTARFSFINFNRSPNGELRASLSEADIAARNEFFRALLHQDGETLSSADLTAPCVAWYGKFLECRFRGAWTVVTREALKDLPPTRNEPLEGDIGVVYHFMSLVATMLLEKDRKGLAISEIVDQADNSNLLKEQRDGQRAIPIQLVFQAVGWLTMLYDPEPVQRPDQLSIRKALGSIARPRRRTRPGRIFTHYVQDIDGNDQPLYLYFRKFGHLIPEIGTYPKGTELITVSHVCFSILDKVADVKIEWVNSLSQHLEFDNVRRVLKLFRFPSFCLLMYRDLTSITNVYLDHSKILGGIRPEQTEDMTPEFFREIILSYRLIFGQNKASQKAFKNKISTFPDHWDRSDKHSDDADPMLRILCSSSHDSSDAKQIYDDIDASEGVSPYYYPDSDFPFLGRRILDLQTFVSGRNPHNWKGLWNDRRNIGLWWTFWAVFIIGVGTIIPQFIQTAFQIWGSVSAYYQLGNPTSTAPPG